MKDRKNILIFIALILVLALSFVLPFYPKGDTKEKSETPQAKTKQEKKHYDYSYEIEFSELLFSKEDNTFSPSELTTQGLATGDIAPFYESYTENCSFIEGKVTDAYKKRYEYTLASSKFTEGGKAECYTVSVVYEFEIERVWRGEFKKGEKILIEDMQLFCGSQFYMKKGHRYLVPIYDAGEDIAILAQGKLLEGETKRISLYSTEYPYHPQIELTDNGYYFFPDDWESLKGEGSIKVKNAKFNEGTVYYKDKMLLLDAKSFEERFKEFLSKDQ